MTNNLQTPEQIALETELKQALEEIFEISNPRYGQEDENYVMDNILLFTIDELKESVNQLQQLIPLAEKERFGARSLIPKTKRQRKHPTLSLAIASKQGESTVGFTDQKHFYRIENDQLNKVYGIVNC